MKKKIKDLAKLNQFLLEFIPQKDKLFLGEFGIGKIKRFLKVLDSPQNKLNIIHIAGTSGKGSTAFYISKLIESQGFKVGLMLSPHISDIRERFQINNLLIEEKKVVKYFNQFIKAIEKYSQISNDKLSYFEIIASFGFYVFQQERVDFAVIETGLGGLYDGTNCVNNKNKLAVLTKIGLDHTNILGKTISEIAYQKAGIINNKNEVISINQANYAKKIIQETAVKNSSPVSFIKNQQNFKIIKQKQQSIFFNFTLGDLVLKNLELNTLARYQVENCSLALAVLEKLSEKYKFKIETKKIFSSLKKSSFPGRMEYIIYNNKQIILDGAHNPQKMQSFISSLSKSLPNKKLDFILSFKRGKDYKKIINALLPMAKKIYLTDFSCSQDFVIKSESPIIISEYLSKKKFSNWEIIENPVTALNKMIKNKSKTCIITGSFYLLSSVYPQLKKVEN